MTAYYNEIEAYPAEWLRNLIAAGHIAPGHVDHRSIEDVRTDDLGRYRQCHFFAGIGIWSHALRLARWPDDRSVWTGSCPCQPFSRAGLGKGFDDKRHLWPTWFRLIEQCCPSIILGEQVASTDAGVWIDAVQDDLEALGYAFGAIPFPAAGVGAPHIRDRLYWVAYTASARPQGSESSRERDRPQPQAVERRGSPRIMADADSTGRGIIRGRGVDREAQPGSDPNSLEQVYIPGPVDGFWRDADWIKCRDDKWRAVEPGTQPLVDGTSGRVGRLRAYGNAIVAPQAQAFIEIVSEILSL